MTDTVITLTTIPPRMDRIERTIESLLAQTAKISAIQVWVPRSYRRPEFGNYTLPKLPVGVELRICETDLGPATKVLPAAASLAGEDVRIIYCDDDEYYAPDWAEVLIRNSEIYPDACVAIAGLNIASITHEWFKRSWKFRLLKIATLDFYRAHYRQQNAGARPGIGPVDICQGFGGVIVKPGFFGQAAQDIPDVLWTVDDIWLSGQLALNGIAIRKVSEQKMCEKTELASVADLTSYNYQGHGRVKADYMCVEYFRRNYGIWN